MTDMYRFTPAFEAQVVHHLTHNKGFATTYGPFMAADMFRTEPGHVVWAAVESIYKDLDDMPGCPEMVEQRMQTTVNTGKLSQSKAVEAMMYMYSVDEPREVSYIAPELTALLRGYGNFKLTDEMTKAVVQRKSLAPFAERIQRIEALGQAGIVTQDEWRFLDDNLFDWLGAEGKLVRLRTGITELDVFLDGGLPKGTLTTAVGRSGDGKSFLCNQLLDASLESGIDGVYITLENPGPMVWARLLAPFLGVPHADILRDPEKAKVLYADLFKRRPDMGRPLVRHYTAGTAVETIKADFRALQKKHPEFKPGFIAFDYLMLASMLKNPGGDAHRRYIMAGEIAKALRAWAEEDDLVMMTAAQASKNRSHGKRGRLTLDDIADSMNIARDSDIVLTVNVDTKQTEGSDVTEKTSCIGVIKHRQGRSGDHTSDRMTAYSYGQVHPSDLFNTNNHDYSFNANANTNQSRWL